MNDLVSIRNEAKQLAMQAVNYDNAGNIEEACTYYIKAASKLKECIRLDESANSKEVYKKRAMDYCERAQQIKNEMQSKTQAAQGGPSAVNTQQGKVDNSLGKSVVKEEQKKVDSSNLPNEKKENTKEQEKDKPKEQDAETKKLMESLSGTIVTEKPNVKWTDIAGLTKAKEALQEAVILPLKFPQLFTGKRKPWKGILLYGPPGTGKSFLAKACATEAKGTFYSVSASNIVSKWMGESERLVRALFDLARANRPAIIFIDEIDSLMSSRSEGENESTRRIKTEFLVQMQGVGKQDDGILVLGATNIPWDLDPAVRRRFQRKIYIGLPDYEARRVMVKLNLGKCAHVLTEDDFDVLASRTEGFSGSDIYTLTQDAIYEPLRKCQNAKYFKKTKDGLYMPCSPSDQGAMKMTLSEVPEPEKVYPPDVSAEDYFVAMSKIKRTVSEKDLEKQDEFTRDFGQEG